VAEDIRKLRTERGIDVGREGGLELSGKRDVCEGNALRCKVRAGSQMLFDDDESGSQAFLENGVDRFVVGVDGTLDELKDKGVVTGNVSIDKSNPLVN